jgi:hypothetical protein
LVQAANSLPEQGTGIELQRVPIIVVRTPNV